MIYAISHWATLLTFFYIRIENLIDINPIQRLTSTGSIIIGLLWSAITCPAWYFDTFCNNRKLRSIKARDIGVIVWYPLFLCPNNCSNIPLFRRDFCRYLLRRRRYCLFRHKGIQLNFFISPKPTLSISITRDVKRSKMVQELHFHTVHLVLTSWQSLRRIKNYEEVVGVKLFQS